MANNLEFRLGVSVGAAVAEAWNANVGGAKVPSLAEWRETTKLPWIGFWFRELLRWGTRDPFVAFVMAQGLAGTREAATVLRAKYETWLANRTFVSTAEERIDPQLFLAWMEARPRAIVLPAVPTAVAADLTRVTGSHASYAVRPIVRDGIVTWMDPAGFEIGIGQTIPGAGAARPSEHDLSSRTTSSACGLRGRFEPRRGGSSQPLFQVGCDRFQRRKERGHHRFVVARISDHASYDQPIRSPNAASK